MKTNMGKTDRFIRLVAGIALITCGYFINIWFAAVGLVLITTAALRWCPPYALLGISTCAKK